MAETAVHLSDHVFPRLPVPQWMLSFPKRLLRILAIVTGDSGRIVD
jgi:hypothetical protein